MDICQLSGVDAFSISIFLIFLVRYCLLGIFIDFFPDSKIIMAYKRLFKKSIMQKVEISYSPKPQRHIFMTFGERVKRLA